MKLCYVIQLSEIKIAIADIHEYLGGYRISRINVPQGYRGRGHGSELLRRITRDADEERAPLYLEPSESGGLTHSQLVDWYKRNSFVEFEQGLKRLPQ